MPQELDDPALPATLKRRTSRRRRTTPERWNSSRRRRRRRQRRGEEGRPVCKIYALYGKPCSPRDGRQADQQLAPPQCRDLVWPMSPNALNSLPAENGPRAEQRPATTARRRAPPTTPQRHARRRHAGRRDRPVKAPRPRTGRLRHHARRGNGPGEDAAPPADGAAPRTQPPLQRRRRGHRPRPRTGTPRRRRPPRRGNSGRGAAVSGLARGRGECHRATTAAAAPNPCPDQASL